MCIYEVNGIMYTTCDFAELLEGGFMDEKKMTECQIEIKKLREQTGMNRKEFCEYFDIPYRTVTEWERGNRNAPDYVLRLLAYYIQMEKLMENPNRIEFEAVKKKEGKNG